MNTFDPSSNSSYLTYANVYNNTGADATVVAWLDYDGNGVYDASDGISITIPSSPTIQSVPLYWPNTTSPFLKYPFGVEVFILFEADVILILI